MTIIRIVLISKRDFIDSLRYEKTLWLQAQRVFFLVVLDHSVVNAFQVKDDRTDAVRAAGNDVIILLHPGLEIPPVHQSQQALVNIVPSPRAKVLWW